MPPTSIANEVPPPAQGRTREKRKIKDIVTDIIYDERLHPLFGPFAVEPTLLEVMRAVEAGETDDRAYDDALRAVLGQECMVLSNFNPATGANLGPLITEIRKYHVRRVAYFVINEWDNQIIGLNEHGQLRDGGHRLRAAIYMGWEEVWIEEPTPPAPAHPQP